MKSREELISLVKMLLNHSITLVFLIWQLPDMARIDDETSLVARSLPPSPARRLRMTSTQPKGGKAIPACMRPTA
jgi:hypothetical protein